MGRRKQPQSKIHRFVPYEELEYVLTDITTDTTTDTTTDIDQDDPTLRRRREQNRRSSRRYREKLREKEHIQAVTHEALLRKNKELNFQVKVLTEGLKILQDSLKQIRKNTEDELAVNKEAELAAETNKEDELVVDENNEDKVNVIIPFSSYVE